MTSLVSARLYGGWSARPQARRRRAAGRRRQTARRNRRAAYRSATPAHFEGRIKELVAGHPSLKIEASELSARATLRRELDGFEKPLQAMA